MPLRRRNWLAVAALAAALAGLWLAAAGTGGRQGASPGAGPGHGRGTMPAAYRGLTNPLSATPETLAAGERLYMRDCAFCHGAAGRGDGPAAQGLVPRPIDFGSLQARGLNDARFFWKVSDGVRGTGMPAWSGTLSPEARWQVITFIRYAFQRP